MADPVKIAEELYYEKNPTTKMNVPSSIYEMVEEWYQQWSKEWIEFETTLNFKDWIKEHRE